MIGISALDTFIEKHHGFVGELQSVDGNTVKIKVLIPKPMQYSKQFVREVMELPIVKAMSRKTSIVGKKDSPWNGYEFDLVLTTYCLSGLDNPVIDALAAFIKAKGISDLDGYHKAVVSLLYSLSEHAHVMDDFGERKQIRLTKLGILKYLHSQKVYDSVSYELSYSDDMLVYFVFGEHSFHVRKAHWDLGPDIPLLDTVHQKKEVDPVSIDLSYQNELIWLRNIRDIKLFDVALERSKTME